MSKPSKAQLAKRWNHATVERIESLLQASQIDREALEREAGLVASGGGDLIDLRAFPLSRPIDQASLDRFDFSFCTWSADAAFTRIQATECRFVAARFDATALTCRFVRCDFSGSAFSECLGMPDTAFEDCVFDDCRFRAGMFYLSAFRGCSFCRARIPRTEMEECLFEECRFDDAIFRDGSFGRSRFVGSRTNFAYVHLQDMSKRDYVANPGYATVDLGETNMIGVAFE